MEKITLSILKGLVIVDPDEVCGLGELVAATGEAKEERAQGGRWLSVSPPASFSMRSSLSSAATEQSQGKLIKIPFLG